jgi:hypothetical protein
VVGIGEWIEIGLLALVIAAIWRTRMTISEMVWWARRRKTAVVVAALAVFFVALFGHFVFDWWR